MAQVDLSAVSSSSTSSPSRGGEDDQTVRKRKPVVVGDEDEKQKGIDVSNDHDLASIKQDPDDVNKLIQE